MTQKMLVLVGVVLLVAGILLPIEGAPGGDYSENLWDVDSENDIWADGPGLYMLIMLVVSVLLVLMGRVEYVKLPGLIIFWIVFLTFIGSWHYFYNTDFDGFGIGWIALWAGCILICTPLWAGYLNRSGENESQAIVESSDELVTDNEFADNDDEPDAHQPIPRLNFRRKLHLIGLLVLLVGFLVPISKNSSSDITYFYSGVQYSRTFLFFMLIAVTIALAFNQDEYVWFLGLIILLMIVNDWRITYMQAQNAEQLRMMWGWLVPINGAAMLTLSVLTDVDETERLFGVFGVITAWFKSLDPNAPFEDDDELEDGETSETNEDSVDSGDETEKPFTDDQADQSDDV